MALSTTQIQNAYVAFFNRPADVAGLTYWGSYAGSAGDLLNTFAQSAEYNALYKGMNNTQLVNAVYQNLFGRSPDVDGLNYWVNQLDSGKVTIGNAANTIQTGAQGTDKSIIDNKVAAATAFTTALDTTAEIVGYAGASSATLGQVKAWLSTVTDTSTSLEAAKTGLTALTGSLAGGTNEAATTYVLTSNQDILTGTNNNDSFRAVAGNAIGAQDQTTLNSSDIIDGGAGTDALIVNMTGAAYNGGARIKNVETLQIGTNQAAATFEYNVNAGSNEVTGVKTIVADQINTGEALTINNLVRDDATTAIPTVSWVNDNTGANGLAGTVNVNYRAATVAGTADEQALSLTNVRAGTLNLATGVEKATLTSAGTATNSIDKVQSGTTLIDVVIKADAQLGGARVVSDVAATKGLEINRTPTNANTEHTSFVNLGASVKNVTAEGSKAGVNIAFTDTTAVDNTFVGGDGADTVIVNGGNDKLSGGKGDDTFIFRQTNTSANGSFFNNSDSLVGGDGKDTILIDYAKDSGGAANIQTQVVIQTSEWLNSKGLDVLDLRATNTRVQLDDAFVGSNDVGSFEVVTNKIVQNDSTSSVADEANSRHQIDLTTVGASRPVKVTGGEGRESVIVTDALNGVQTVAGGNGLDVLVVQNGATLTGQDLANVSGMNVFNLVKTSANAQSYQIDLTAAFLDKAVDANASAGTSKNTANAFRILTDTADGSGTANTISGVQTLAAGDTINITVDTTGLTTAGAINLDDLIASGATLTVKNTSGTTLLAAANGVVTTAGTGIFAGAAATANTAYTDLTANAVAGVGTPVASGQASSGGSSGSVAGNTFTLTAASAVLTPTTSVNVTPAGMMSTGNDTINANTFTAAFVQDASTTDADVFNVIVNAANAPTLVNVETVNATMAGNTLTTTGFTGVNTINVSGATGTIMTAATTMPTIALSSGYAAVLTATAAAAGNAVSLRLDGTTTGSGISTNSTAATVNVAASSTLSTLTTGAGAVTLTGSGNLTLGTVTTATSIAGGTMTGALTYTDTGIAVTSGSGNDVFTLGAATTASINAGAGNDSFTAVAGSGLTSTDTLNGGDGTDSVTLTGSTAVTGTDFNNVSNIEAITVANTTTNVAITTVEALVAAGATLTGTFSTLTTGTLTFNGAAENNGFFNITGGGAADTITGGLNADTITGGNGADSITGGAGNDRIVLTESTAAVDIVAFSGGAVTAAAQLVANGYDTITGWGSTDTINVAALGDGTTGANAAVITAAAAQSALTDDRSYVISTTGAAANLTTGGTAVVTDFTNTAQIAAYLAERFTLTGGDDEAVMVINNTTSGANRTYIYSIVDADSALTAADIALVGVIDNGGNALAAANVVYA